MVENIAGTGGIEDIAGAVGVAVVVVVVALAVLIVTVVAVEVTLCQSSVVLRLQLQYIHQKSQLQVNFLAIQQLLPASWKLQNSWKACCSHHDWMQEWGCWT